MSTNYSPFRMPVYVLENFARTLRDRVSIREIVVPLYRHEYRHVNSFIEILAGVTLFISLRF